MPLGHLKKATMYLHFLMYRLFVVDNVLNAGDILASPKSAGSLRSGLGPVDRTSWEATGARRRIFHHPAARILS